MRIYFATDVHGSEVCWRKFLNAADFYQADVLILGGDVTGKAMVPIVEREGGWEVTYQDHHQVLRTEEEVRGLEERIRARGFYPIRLTPEEKAELDADPAKVEERFTEEMIGTVERWMAMAEEKLGGRGIPLFTCPGNDDQFEVDEVMERSEVVRLVEGKVVELDGLELVSTGWTNPSPWDTYREMPEEDLAKRIDKMVGRLRDPERAIFNFHAPPYDTGLDHAPALDPDLRPVHGGQELVPVGSKAVREAIERYQPLLSLHGHIHESRGAVRLGRTLAINPGSSYEEGALEGAVIEVDSRRGVRSHVLVSG